MSERGRTPSYYQPKDEFDLEAKGRKSVSTYNIYTHTYAAEPGGKLTLYRVGEMPSLQQVSCLILRAPPSRACRRGRSDDVFVTFGHVSRLTWESVGGSGEGVVG